MVVVTRRLPKTSSSESRMRALADRRRMQMAGMSHDIRQPLTALRVTIESMARDAPDETGGTVNFGGFFSGEDLGLFGGAEWQTPVDGLSVKLEYSDDPYTREENSGRFDKKIPFNFGLEYIIALFLRAKSTNYKFNIIFIFF